MNLESKDKPGSPGWERNFSLLCCMMLRREEGLCLSDFRGTSGLTPGQTSGGKEGSGDTEWASPASMNNKIRGFATIVIHHHIGMGA